VVDWTESLDISVWAAVVGWQNATAVNTRTLSSTTDSTTVVQGGPWSVTGTVDPAL
jgi:hypothetical protein